MALGNLVTLNRTAILNQIPNIIILWIGTLADIEEDFANNSVDQHIQTEVEDWLEENGSAEASRRIALHHLDPLNNVVLHDYLTQKLNAAGQIYGDRLEEVMKIGVEPLLLKEFSERLGGTYQIQATD